MLSTANLLFLMVSVTSGWSLPYVSLYTFRALSYSGTASAKLPWSVCEKEASGRSLVSGRGLLPVGNGALLDC